VSWCSSDATEGLRGSDIDARLTGSTDEVVCASPREKNQAFANDAERDLQNCDSDLESGTRAHTKRRQRTRAARKLRAAHLMAPQVVVRADGAMRVGCAVPASSSTRRRLGVVVVWPKGGARLVHDDDDSEDVA
jgi:hypothetical protein